MNYVMTKKNVLPMHCSANMDPETHETAVFSVFQELVKLHYQQTLTAN